MVRIIDLGSYKYRNFIDENNVILGVVPINSKATLQEQQKITDFSTSVVAQTIATSSAITSGQITTNDIVFYRLMINAIDNMIMTTFIRDYIMPQKLEPVEYYVTKSNDINMDIALFYYTVEYPTDTTVDTAKLNKIKEQLTQKIGITF
jgi:hypothetical protein